MIRITNQTVHWKRLKMLAPLKKKRLLILTACGILVGLAGGLKPLVYAQNSPLPIRLIDVAKYYEGLSHQDRALRILQSQIDAMNPELLQGDSIMANVWRNADVFLGHMNFLNDIPTTNRAGPDPLDLAIAAANLPSGAPVHIEVLPESAAESPTQVIVTITQAVTADDSVAGIRYRFDIQRQNDTWEIQKAGKQFRCQSGRGQQDWADALCS
jgi:hypothetical protein